MIIEELKIIKDLFTQVVKIIPEFDITDENILPYGLKPHTRSVSWIVEQVIIQQTKFNKNLLGVSGVTYDLPDACLHDCEILSQSKKYYVNIKITQANQKQNKNDISAVEKLFNDYKNHPNYRLIYAVFKFKFDNITISLKDDVHIFSPQFLPIYINPRNDKLQAKYYAEPEIRTRSDFLEVLREKSSTIKLKK
ncbi:MAG: hypothetical protein OXC02_08695 [Rhodobacteraceae bacterium]|nr:hypothetical protein [Paracoccaceae bacterium]